MHESLTVLYCYVYVGCAHTIIGMTKINYIIMVFIFYVGKMKYQRSDSEASNPPRLDRSNRTWSGTNYAYKERPCFDC